MIACFGVCGFAELARGGFDREGDIRIHEKGYESGCEQRGEINGRGEK